MTMTQVHMSVHVHCMYIKYIIRDLKYKGESLWLLVQFLFLYSFCNVITEGDKRPLLVCSSINIPRASGSSYLLVCAL